MHNRIKKPRTTLDLLCSISRNSKETPQPPPSWHSPFNWTSVPNTRIGMSDLKEAATFSYAIPTLIPSTALEVLVYVAMNTGDTSGGTNDLKIYTQIGTKQYAKYLFAHPFPQPAWNTNSENMWFPMPSNRLVYLTVATASGADAGVYLSVIGYR